MNKDFEDKLAPIKTGVKDILYHWKFRTVFTLKSTEFAKVYEIINAKIITNYATLFIYQMDFWCLQENKHSPMLPPADGISNYKDFEVRLILSPWGICLG